MNERIEKLGEQVDLLGDCTPTKIPGRYVGYINIADIEKFAELIVRECIAWVEEHNGHDGPSIVEMKEHFGVE